MSGLRFGLNLSMQRRERLWPPCTHGPDGGLPVQESLWYRGQGWCDGSLYASVSAYLAAASGAFSRGSDGTRFDASGIMQVDGPNVLRLDHDPATGEALGLRAEGPATELLRQSANVGTSSSPWTGDSVFAAIRAKTSIFASATAWEHVADGIGSRSRYQNAAIVASTAYRLSIIVEEGPVPAAVLDFGLYQSTPTTVWRGLARFTWATGALVTQQGAISDPRVENWGTGPNGGRLRRLSCNIDSGAGANRIFVYPNGVDAPSSGVSTILHHYGAAVDSGLTSSPIITAGAGIIRFADGLSYVVAGTPEGTIVVSARTALGAVGSQTLWCWDDGTTANRYRLMRDSNRNLRFVVTVSGTDVVNLDLGTVADDTGLKVAASWKSGLFAASLNGAAAVTDTSYAGSLPTVTTMREGAASNGSEWFGTIKRMRRYSTAYSAAQLPGMSS